MSADSFIVHNRSAFERVTLFVTCAALLNVIGCDKMKLAVDMATLKRRGLRLSEEF
jgi:hypothetical protein